MRIQNWAGRACVRSMAVLAACVCSARAESATIAVAAGGNLQTALTNAQAGDTIQLAPGATYTGNFTMPNKGGSETITLQTSPAGLPGDGARVSPADAAR